MDFIRKYVGEDMKGYKRLLFVCVAISSMFLGGCGDSLHELTVEEENLIVHYAAYAVAKHNIQQKDGMSGVDIPEEEEEELLSTKSEDNAIDSETDDIQNPEGGGDVSNEGQTVENAMVSMAQAIGHENDLFITYGGSTVADNYVEGSVYSLDASAGNTFYIMKFFIANPTQTDVTLDNVTQSLVFKLTSGEMSVQSEVTFLMTDLSTYYGTIAAGQSVEAILLFEVPEGSADSITEPALQIIIDNQTKNIKL